MGILQRYGWPGNVRELRNLMERLVLMTPGACIRAEDLPEALHQPGRKTVRDGGEEESLDQARKRFERAFLEERLRDHGGNISRTAEAVGLARESLSRKIRALGIEIERE